MTSAKKLGPISVEDYLFGEQTSTIKHEYIGGTVYSMVGGRNVHNLIASNALVSLGSRLRGQSCRAYNSDTKIRLRLPRETRFYYPDASVICRPNPQADTFQDEPAVVIEVLSNRTRRVDHSEKKEAYLSIPSLFLYLTLEQETPAAICWRRTDLGFIREEYTGLNATIPLRELETDLPLTELYDGVEFSPEFEE